MSSSASPSPPPTAVSLARKKLQIAGVVLAYFTVSIALVFSNKILLSSEGATIPAPLFVTWFQCVLTGVIIYLLGCVAEGSEPSAFMRELPSKKPEYKYSVARGVLPLSAIFVGMITFNNLCLKYVEVSFYNVARSLTIVFNVGFTYLLLGEKTSFRTCLTLMLVIAGFFIGSEGEANFSLIGTLCGVASSVFVCLNAIYTSKVMPLVDKDKWKLAYYNNVNAAILFLPLIILTGEWKTILVHSDLLFSTYFWCMMLFAGFLGFMIGIVTVMQIQFTSPLTHNISGTAKACVQTILAYMVWKNEATFKANVGVALVILGSGVYAYVRMQEMDAAAAAKKNKQYVPLDTKVPSAVDDQSSQSMTNGSVSPITLNGHGKASPNSIELTNVQKV